MAIRVREVAGPEYSPRQEIQERARKCSRNAYTKLYVASRDGIDVALVALDWYPLDGYVQPAPFVLYELWVAPSDRGSGVGSLCLEWVEATARGGTYRVVTLTARPIEAGTDKERLQCWYQVRGYVLNGDDRMTKPVAPKS